MSRVTLIHVTEQLMTWNQIVVVAYVFYILIIIFKF